MTAHSGRAHATLGASGAYRWFACPGSIRLTAGITPTSSRYAEEGTAAHEMAEWCLREGRMAVEGVGRRFNGVEADGDMAEAVRVYLDHVRSITHERVCQLNDADNLNTEPDLLVWIEKRFDLRSWAAEQGVDAELFGTNDLAIYAPATRKLTVIDYKHGAGVPVEVFGNPQLRYYALGAVLELAKRDRTVSEVEITVIQPRAPHPAGPVRTEAISAFDLVEWSADLLDAARATQQDDAPLQAGAHCRFCPAAATCPALRDHSLEVARMEFADPARVPPAADTLSPVDIGVILRRADVVEDWLRAVREHAFNLLNQGIEVPGWKLVAKRALRQWVDEDLAADLLAGRKVEPYERKLISPAKAEDALKATGLTAKDAKAAIQHLVVAVSSGNTIAPDADRRPAVTGGAAGDFTALPSPTD